MDYKAKYEEALERARALHDEAIDKGYVIDYVKDYETIFPELRESEDERMIEAIIYALNSHCNSINHLSARGYQMEDVKAWLEKRKINTEGDYGRGYDCGYQAGYAVAMNEMKPKVATATLDSEKQKEQKPTLPRPHKGDEKNPYDMGVSEAQEYAINRGFGIPVNDGEVFVDERYITQTIGNILRWADEHPKEQKPAEWDELQAEFRNINEAFEDGKKEVVAHPEKYGLCKPAEWSEEDEKMIQSIVLELQGLIECSPNPPGFEIRVRKEQNWLKSLHPQKLDASKLENFDPVDVLNEIKTKWPMAWEKVVGKQEWSKEDEEMLNILINRLHTVQLLTRTDSTSINFSFFKEIGWLKSLRDRAIWRPSKEQMEALNYAIAEWDGGKRLEGLYALRNDLKKLMED